ncbi:MAG: methyltransferase domain-containing protein [Leptonema illini]|jgi:SAM-dependent methyltransferase|uniref:Methyltransferase domain-containing protein n=1 Tax=Leptonema illini TaxID=183 RepID=A0A833H370_9LEPT|nr:MAG: methyltransferase domain-containing protein [Leptonema illini]
MKLCYIFRMKEWNSNLYDGSHAFVSELGKGVLSLLQPRQDERIIDLGCGTGDLAVEIAGSGARVVGVDASEEMLRRAREKWSGDFPDIRFERADIRNLSRYSGFDAAFSNATLHWVKEAEQAAKQIAGVLRPGGRFVAEFGGYRNVEQICRALTEAANAAGLGIEYPWYYPEADEYRVVLEKAGFEVQMLQWFRRPTDLGLDGLANWYAMFVKGWWNPTMQRDDNGRDDSAVRYRERQSFEHIRNEIFKTAVQNYALSGHGNTADYVRLRVVATRL